VPGGRGCVAANPTQARANLRWWTKSRCDSVCPRSRHFGARLRPRLAPDSSRLNPNSEVGHEIERTCRAPSAVGRVTPCAPRLPPAGAKFPRRRLPDPLPIQTLLEFSVPTSFFGLNPASCRLSSRSAAGNIPDVGAKQTHSNCFLDNTFITLKPHECTPQNAPLPHQQRGGGRPCARAPVPRGLCRRWIGSKMTSFP